jgi:hypothetical protein
MTLFHPCGATFPKKITEAWKKNILKTKTLQKWSTYSNPSSQVDILHYPRILGWEAFASKGQTL